MGLESLLAAATQALSLLAGEFALRARWKKGLAKLECVATRQNCTGFRMNRWGHLHCWRKELIRPFWEPRVMSGLRRY